MALVVGRIAVAGIALLAGSSLLGPGPEPDMSDLTVEQRSLVADALTRFELHDMDLPELEFVFHSSLHPCGGRKGLYHGQTRVLEMCSLDRVTIIHELAHAWAGVNLTDDQREAFVVRHELDSWNDHAHEWAQRGTEHVAETIAWAILEDPHHVRWMEESAEGTLISYRLLTIGIDVPALLDNFEALTGKSPIFRDSREWDPASESTSISPEAMRLKP